MPFLEQVVAKSPNPKDQSARIPARILKMARLIAAFEDKGISQVIAEAAGPALEKKMKDHGLPLPKS